MNNTLTTYHTELTNLARQIAPEIKRLNALMAPVRREARKLCKQLKQA